MAHLIRTQHPAHCEYFASAAALLLRAGGVPTRYVCGYVVDEYNDDTERWLARNRDAHAWVEAYDDESQKWFHVEATPGRTFRDDRFPQQETNADLATEDLENDNQQQATWLATVWQSFSRFFSRRFSLPAIHDLAVASRLPLFGMVVASLMGNYYLNWKKRLSTTDPHHRMLRLVDRRLAKCGLRRDQAENLHRFADRVADVASKTEQRGSLPDPQLQAAATWYRNAEEARCQGRTVPTLPWQRTNPTAEESVSS